VQAAINLQEQTHGADQDQQYASFACDLALTKGNAQVIPCVAGGWFDR